MSDLSLETVREVEYPRWDSPSVGGVYLDTASFGLLPRRTRDAVRSIQERRANRRGLGDLDPTRELAAARVAAARLIKCEADAITLAPNTSYGINLAARLVAAGPPGTVVVSDGEFPANVHPWLALESEGFRVKRVEGDRLGCPDPEGLRRALDGNDVRAFALSVIQFSNGVLSDVEAFGEVCRERGILYCLDGIQSLGVVPLDVAHVGADVLASGGQKWMCSPWGSGFVYIDPELHERFDPPMVSWLSKADSLDFDALVNYGPEYLPDGRKFELGTLGIQDHMGMARSLELILELGVEEIGSHVTEVLRPLVDWVQGTPGASAVTPVDPEERGGIFTFRVTRPRELHRSLAEAGFTLTRRGEALRVAPHFYNTAEEMTALVERLSRLCG